MYEWMYLRFYKFFFIIFSNLHKALINLIICLIFFSIASLWIYSQNRERGWIFKCSEQVILAWYLVILDERSTLVNFWAVFTALLMIKFIDRSHRSGLLWKVPNIFKDWIESSKPCLNVLNTNIIYCLSKSSCSERKYQLKKLFPTIFICRYGHAY